VLDIRELIRRVQLGETDRQIARDLQVSRKTVPKYRAWAQRHDVLTGPLPDAATLHAQLNTTLLNRASSLGSRRQCLKPRARQRSSSCRPASSSCGRFCICRDPGSRHRQMGPSNTSYTRIASFPTSTSPTGSFCPLTVFSGIARRCCMRRRTRYCVAARLDAQRRHRTQLAACVGFRGKNVPPGTRALGGQRDVVRAARRHAHETIG
jgi:hypothetical protein